MNSIYLPKERTSIPLHNLKEYRIKGYRNELETISGETYYIFDKIDSDEITKKLFPQPDGFFYITDKYTIINLSLASKILWDDGCRFAEIIFSDRTYVAH